MNVQEIVLPEGRRVRVGPTLSRDARQRLVWMDYYLAHRGNARLTCRRFGISSATFYRWWHRYDPRRLASLEARSRRPRRVRQPQTPPDVVARIRALRETYPRWGKTKLAVLLRREGWTVADSTVGRTLTRLRRLGQLREPPVVNAQKRRRRRKPRPYAQRMRWGYVIRRPGDLVQVDTMLIRVDVKMYRVHFTARDVVSRKDVVAAYDRASSRSAERFLREELPRLGFPVCALQIDGGSEFKASFEAACQALGILLFVLPHGVPSSTGT
jgi:putative transposase